MDLIIKSLAHYPISLTIVRAVLAAVRRLYAQKLNILILLMKLYIFIYFTPNLFIRFLCFFQ